MGKINIRRKVSIPGWNPPRVIDIGQVAACSLAIRAVELEGKPIVEVMTLRAKRSLLESDLKECLKRERAPRSIKYFVRKVYDNRYVYGFYREPWTLEALNFIYRATLPPEHRDWVAGLLFGYEPREIGKYLDKQRRRRRGKHKKAK